VSHILNPQKMRICMLTLWIWMSGIKCRDWMQCCF